LKSRLEATAVAAKSACADWEQVVLRVVALRCMGWEVEEGGLVARPWCVRRWDQAVAAAVRWVEG
jgi:hypothetical protein